MKQTMTAFCAMQLVIAAVSVAHGQTADNAALPKRAQVTYRGNWNAPITAPARGNRPSRTVTLGGDFNIVATISGDRVSASIWGNGFRRATFNGTVRDGICHVSSSGLGATDFEGPCDSDGFSGRIVGENMQGYGYEGSFDTASVQVVDLDVQQRQQQAAQREEQARIAAAEAKLRAAPPAGPALTAKLEGFVRKDSLGWVMNRYDQGTISNVKIVDGSAKSGTFTMRGVYTYNGGVSGWVLAKLTGSKLSCIQFHDSYEGCRALREPTSKQIDTRHPDSPVNDGTPEYRPDCRLVPVDVNGAGGVIYGQRCG